MSYEYLHLAGGPVADGWQPQAVAGGQQDAQAGHLQATAIHKHYLRLFVMQLDIKGIPKYKKKKYFLP